jgi:hypothetical protein
MSGQPEDSFPDIFSNQNSAVNRETSRTGPDHRPHFAVRVRIADRGTFEGSGPSFPDASRAAAGEALVIYYWKCMRDPAGILGKMDTVQDG